MVVTSNMTSSQDYDTGRPPKRSGFNIIDRLNLRPYTTGLLPLFILAHFSHHGIMAMLRPLLPMIRTDMGLNLTQAGFVMSAFTLTNGLAQLPAGWVADRFGARLMVLLGVTGVAVAGFVIGFSNSFMMLIIFLILSALMGGGYHPASVTALSRTGPEEYRGRSLGFHLIGGTGAFWMVPLLVAPIAATWGWRMPFKIIPIPMIIVGIILYILIGKRMRAIEAEQKKAPGAEPAEKAPIPWGKLVPFMVISVLTGTIIMSTSSFLSFFAVDELGVPEATIPLLLAISPGVGVIAAPMGGYLSDRFGGMKVIMTLAVTAVPLIYLMGISPNVGVLIALMIATGIVSMVRMPTSESFIAGNTPDHRRSTMLGIYFFAGTGAAGPLAPLVGNMIDRIGYQATFAYAAAVMAAITAVSALFIWRYSKRSTQYPRMPEQ